MQYQQALKHYQKAVQLAPDNTNYLNDLGFIYDTLANHQKAIDYFELALASGLKTYGEDHPKVAIRRNNLGSAWDSLGEYQKAIDYYELALQAVLKTFDELHPTVVTIRNNLEKARQKSKSN